MMVIAAFLGGAVASELARADSAPSSPYRPLEQLARALVLVENEYVDPVERGRIADGAIKGLVGELDPHSAYMGPEEYARFRSDTEGKFAGIGVEVEMRGDVITVLAPMDGSPAAAAGIRPGDQIVAVDNKPVRGERLDKLVSLIRGPVGTKVTVTVARPGVNDPLSFPLTRAHVHVKSVISKLLDKGVAYVRIKQFQEGTHEELLRAAAALRAEAKVTPKKLVLDLRNNAGGLVNEAEDVADELLASGVIYTTRHRGKVLEKVDASAGGAFASCEVVVLVNEYSASSSELVAGALQDNGRAKLVGTPTFGKGSVQTIFNLPGGAGMRLTTARYYTPSGRSIQAQGIVPDVWLKPVRDKGPGEVVRERDLEGHLQAEGGGPPRTPLIIEDKRQKKEPDLVASKEIPQNPLDGDDLALAVGYRLVLTGKPQ